ncbi:c-type cytochrome [Vibrio antiquarius]
MCRALLLSVFFSLLSGTTIAQTIQDELYREGADLAQNCAGCHGINGISPVDSNPNLAGQKKAYIEYALKAYRGQQRAGGKAIIMYGNAAGLTDQEIEALAIYFSSQQPLTTP